MLAIDHGDEAALQVPFEIEVCLRRSVDRESIRSATCATQRLNALRGLVTVKCNGAKVESKPK